MLCGIQAILDVFQVPKTSRILFYSILLNQETRLRRCSECCMGRMKNPKIVSDRSRAEHSLEKNLGRNFFRQHFFMTHFVHKQIVKDLEISTFLPIFQNLITNSKFDTSVLCMHVEASRMSTKTLRKVIEQFLTSNRSQKDQNPKLSQRSIDVESELLGPILAYFLKEKQSFFKISSQTRNFVF